MRAYFFCFIWLCLGCLNGFSQQTYVPFPCRVLSQQDVQTTGNNLLIRQENCIETSGNILVNNPESVLLESGQSIHLKPGFKAAPGTAEQFNARINRSEVGLVIYEPAQTPGQVPVFEKFELGVDLPDTILQLVERYVAQPRQYPNINPFNPDEISIEAQFFILNENGQFHPFPDGMWMGPEIKYGFYYEDFQRDSASWTKLSNQHPFRIRFASSWVGNWKVKIFVNVQGLGSYESSEYSFISTPSPNPGFLKVHPINKQYLTFSGRNESFFPVGQNLFFPVYLDPAAGITFGGEPYDADPAKPRAYRYYLAELDTFAANGANYFRMLNTPWTTEIEYEHVNDYSGRMSNAWEMDQILNKCKEKDLYLHWNLSIHYVLENPSHYSMYNWDWDDGPLLPGVCDHTTPGYCYKTELGLSDPGEFFTDPEALKNYKHRLRYYISRYSYSTNIAVLELFSEINNAGTVTEVVPPKPAEQIFWCHSNNNTLYSPYENEAPFRADIASWHNIMSNYIRNGLNHWHQILTANYAGVPKNDDHSYSLPYIDMVTYNSYSRLPSRIEGYSTTASNVHQHYNKPLLHAESGAPEVDPCGNYAEWIKTAWISAFSGHAGTALNWSGEHATHLWHHYGRIRNFMSSYDFNSGYYNSYYNKRGDAQNNIGDKQLELSCLISADKTHGMGVILNSHYNYWTQSYHDPDCRPDLGLVDIHLEDCGPCDIGKTQNYPNNLNFFPVGFRSTFDVSPGSLPSENLTISGLKLLTDYAFYYYHAHTGQLLGIMTQQSNLLGRISVEHPELNLFSGDRSIIYFTFTEQGHQFLQESVEEIQANGEMDINLYPNPTSDLLFITLNNELQSDEQIKVEILSAEGRVLYSLTGKESIFNCVLLSSGIYFARITLSDEVITKRFIKTP
ncbi:MAG TPA: T9SS type A sorting domain-containing protein [Flavobacteriales bacterium]|nr:T9SS type A sorting domain-containing protein [Flavobacteriales bacterium]HRE98578.1 T9SS type A sorting domain-containing protein [Flavobacteriales bacterium]HRJ38129.1 T9SS type A sorting domain-containing protein [Flavobacteriales bacterium]